MAPRFVIRTPTPPSVQDADLFVSERTVQPNIPPPKSSTIVGMPRNEDARLFFPSEHQTRVADRAHVRSSTALFTYAPPSPQQFLEPPDRVPEAFGISPVEALRRMAPLTPRWRSRTGAVLLGLPVLLAAGLIGMWSGGEDVGPTEGIQPPVTLAVRPSSSIPSRQPVNVATPSAPTKTESVPPSTRGPATSSGRPAAPAVSSPPANESGQASAPAVTPPSMLAVSGTFAAPPPASLVRLTAPPAPVDTPPAIEATSASALAPASTRSSDTAAVEMILQRYRSAFAALDVNAVKSFWPSVNAGALASAFDQLQLQRFDFDACEIDVTAPRATALCGGTARFVTKVGSRNIRVESRRWTFHLRHIGGTWIMEGVESR